ncbi:restriction endonuclease [Metabacillus niabensis]
MIKSKLEDLTWREFERLCYLYFKSKGYKASETSDGADGGIDLIIYNKHH